MIKFRSRKFLTALVGAVVLVLADGLGLKLEADTIAGVAGIVIAYLASQGYVDGKQ